MGLSSEQLIVFTIGHSNHSAEAFLDLLKTHEIEVLVDVRSYPHSKYAPQFDYHKLRSAVESSGFKYLFLGKELGGRPESAEYYDDGGHVLYSRLAESPAFLEGIARLEKGIRQFKVAVMCSEDDPTDCHRRRLIGHVLMERGIIVSHIRGDGSLQAETEIREAEAKQSSETCQLPLFALEEKPEWKSTQSVLRKEQRRTSSAH